MEVKKGYKANAKYLPISAKKVRPIADNVRKKPYTEAVSILENLPNKGARLLRKVLQSAAANALYHNEMLDEETLYVRELYIDEGPSRVKIWPRSRGRADRLKIRSSHISVVLDEIGSTRK
jgi:large subunit ribosomal protein L22